MNNAVTLMKVRYLKIFEEGAETNNGGAHCARGFGYYNRQRGLYLSTLSSVEFSVSDCRNQHLASSSFCTSPVPVFLAKLATDFAGTQFQEVYTRLCSTSKERSREAGKRSLHSTYKNSAVGKGASGRDTHLAIPFTQRAPADFKLIRF